MKYHLVVVDDDDADRYLVKRALRSLEYDVNLIEYEAGDHFLEVFKDEVRRTAEIGVSPPPILVILDINMPRVSGFEVLEFLRDMLSDDDQIIVATMYSSSDYARDRADASRYTFVKGYIVKPITSNHIKNLIEMYCLPD